MMTLLRTAVLLPRIAAAFAMALLAGCVAPDAHAPPFARVPYEPFSRQAAVATALDEWRLWGSRVDDNPFTYEPADLEAIPEREEGFWQRVGEYWWMGMNAGERDARDTGKHDSSGNVFPAQTNGEYAWSAAFISYVMRIAGAGRDFPYSPAHATYIDAAVRGETPLLAAEDPAVYAPRLGDLICFARASAADLRFKNLPTDGFFPAHCGIVTGESPGEIDMVGGNVDDAVVMTKVAALSGGLLSDAIFKWLVVLRVNYAR
jgi:hypothetical protein